MSSRIIIADEGKGMDWSDIEDKWLNIAYSEKYLQEPEDGKYLAGNKGIGRFSCDRLGAVLDLFTRKGNNELIHLRITWEDFEIEGNKDLTIQSIPLEIVTVDERTANEITGLASFPDTGTVLAISSLRSEWDWDKLKKLKISLEKFLNPNQLFLRNQFHIELSALDFLQSDRKKKYQDRINGSIQNQIFDKLKFNSTYIESIVSENGEIMTTSLYHGGEKVFELVERNASYPLLKKIYLVIYYLNPYKKAYFKRQTGVRSVDFGSIFLFLNGFRVSPYGDRGNDWLNLDVRSTQGYARFLGTRNIIGRIEVSGNEEQFKPVSSREGLKNTAAVQQLKEDFYMDIHLKLEKFVVDGLSWDSVPKKLRGDLSTARGLDWETTTETYSQSWDLKRQRIALDIMNLINAKPENTIRFWFNPALLEDVYESRQQEVEKIFEDIEGFDTGKVDADLSKNLSKFKNLIRKKEEEARVAKIEAAKLRTDALEKKQAIEKLKKETAVYRRQASFFEDITPLDVKDLIFYLHQIKLDSTIAENYMAKSLKLLKGVSYPKSLLSNLQKASLANKRMGVLAQLATKAGFLSGVKKVPTDIPTFIEQYLIYVAKDFIAAGLQLDVANSVQELFEINVSRVELSILIDNIISNSRKARAKNIKIDIAKISDNTIRISFVDDGDGLSDLISQIDSIFEMGITTTSGGSGLGLYQAKQFVDKIDGKIEAINIEPNGMEIRVEVTR